MTITITQMYIIMPVLALAIVLAWHFVPWSVIKQGLQYFSLMADGRIFIPEGYKEDKELKAMVRKPERKKITDAEIAKARKDIKKMKVKKTNKKAAKIKK